MESKYLLYISIAVLVTVFTVSAEELDNKVEEALQDEPTMTSTDDLEGYEPYYDSEYGYDDLDKRGSMFRFGRGALFRFGKRGGGLFRYGKRGGSIFRFGKRGGSIFRFGKREDENDLNEEKRKMFRYGRSDMDEEKRKSMFRYGKRFVRDVKRQKVHTPFRFGREEDEEA